jgi:hypothetical protein
MTNPLEIRREPVWPDVLLWFETIDAIVQGLGHSLNNRALALSATVESLDPRRPVGQQTASGLAREAARLTEQLRQLRGLPFGIERESMPLLLRDVLGVALQLHQSHSKLGDVPVYLEGATDAPPVMAPESALVHATLVTLTSLKGFVAPGGVVRVTFSGSEDLAEVRFLAQRDPDDAPVPARAEALIGPTALVSALLGQSLLQIEQEIGEDSSSQTWTLPSLRATRRRERMGAVPVAGS